MEEEQFSINQNENLTVDEAKILITEFKQRVAMMGNNNIEWDRFNDIESRLSSGELTPNEAVAKANEIVEGKQEV